MSKYIIFLGGTGARCAEAFCHLCMSGMVVDEAETIHILLGDADDQNGNTCAAYALLSQYAFMQERMQASLPGDKLARQKLDVSNWVIGTELFDQQDNGVLREPKLSTLNESGDPAAQENSEYLMRALYTPSEMNNRVSAIGFFAHPNVGAAILRASILHDADVAADKQQFTNAYDAYCASILNDLSGQIDTQVMLVGSLFGGTGAACIPGIAEDIHTRASQLPLAGRGRLTIGTTMLLPYFMLQQGAGNQASIQSDQFQVAAKAALGYYAEQNTPFSKTYLLGLPIKPGVPKRQRGGADQKNHAMVVEWEAAMACMDFFRHPGVEREVFYKGCTLLKDSDQLKVGWGSFSHPSVNLHLGRYLRFALFYKYKLRPDIQSMDKGIEKKGNFYLNYVQRFYTEGNGMEDKGDRILANQLLFSLDQTVDRFLTWFTESLFDPRVQQEMVDQKRLKEVLAVGQSELKSRQGLGKLVTDGADHKDYAAVNEALLFAHFGEPETRRSCIGHLMQGVFAACK